MKKSVEFETLEELRLESGVHLDTAIRILDIDKRTWQRWKSADRAPIWAMTIIKSVSGSLAHLGWEKWHIRNGCLIHDDLDPGIHYWEPGDILSSVYCTCPLERFRRFTENLRKKESTVVTLMSVKPSKRTG